MIFRNYLRMLRRSTNVPERMLQHAGNTATCGTFTPEDDSPTALVIGAHAPKLAVRRLAERHGLQAEDLYAFQDARLSGSEHEPRSARSGAALGL